MGRPLSDTVLRKAHSFVKWAGFSGWTRGEFRFAISDVPAEERISSPMHRAFYENKSNVVHKWRGYLQHYERHFSRYRNTPVRMLEIGVSKGGSLEMWRNYFGPEAIIFGIDINPNCAQYDGRSGNVRIGSQDDRSFIESVVTEMGGVDIVLDDGSHIGRHQRATFEILFPLLDPMGVYVCEDTHTSYWRGIHEGGFRRKNTFIEIAKNVIDDIHAEFHGRTPTVKDANRTISGIHFYNSMVVFEKAPQPPSMNMMAPG